MHNTTPLGRALHGTSADAVGTDRYARLRVAFCEKRDDTSLMSQTRFNVGKPPRSVLQKQSSSRKEDCPCTAF